MRNLATIIALIIVVSVKAAPGDTLKIQSHQQTHWNWAGSWYDTVQFPDTGTYRRVLMHYVLGCPTSGCSGWDYTTKIEISDQLNDSTTQWFELVRIITPYAGDKTAAWTHEWIIDVTDYASLFIGERSIAARYSGYTDGFTISIDFDLIEGEPTRKVLDINQIYHGNFVYGVASNPIDSHLIPTTFQADPNMKSAKFRMVASGHGGGGNENCAEFCDKYYRLYVNGSNLVQHHVWRDDCGANTLEAQTGTWIYSRAGWCPGSETMKFDEEIGDKIQAGMENEIDIDWQNFNYTGGGSTPQYTIESVVFQYDAWKHAIDAAIDDVLKPSLNDQVWDVNPICNNPEVVISNQGSEVLTRVEMEYWTEGAPEKLSYTFKGAIFPGKSTIVTLPSDDWKLFGGMTTNLFHVKIIGANNEADQNEENNEFKSRFDETGIMPSDFVINFSNNLAANETLYRIINDKGEVVFSHGGFSASQSVMDTMSLEPGCYKLLVEDSDCDGLSFFANSDGNGKLWLHNNSATNFYPPIYQFPTQFGCSTELNFTVGYAMGKKEISSNQLKVKAYPNPSLEMVTLAVESGFAAGTISIYNQSGQMVRKDNLATKNYLNIQGLPAGIYTAVYNSRKDSATLKFVVLN